VWAIALPISSPTASTVSAPAGSIKPQRNSTRDAQVLPRRGEARSGGKILDTIRHMDTRSSCDHERPPCNCSTERASPEAPRRVPRYALPMRARTTSVSARQRCTPSPTAPRCTTEAKTELRLTAHMSDRVTD
jgi:hypothetical protein